VVVRAEEIVSRGGGVRFAVRERGERVATLHLHVPGLHNVRNALAAAVVGRHLGASWAQIAEGIASFRGVDRRFEVVGEAGGVLFVDDYAHHPTEVQATLQAARAAYPDRRLVLAFQPHLYSRTRDFAKEFGLALAEADVLFLTDIYAAREQPIPGVTGELIARPARGAGGDVRYVPSRDQLVGRIAEELKPGDLCITMGAGNLDQAARELISTLAATVEA
jgi:UDP-N-acetylmuramate--alanine ligase